MFWRQPVAYASLSDVGFRRANNQDSYAFEVCTDEAAWRQRGHLFLVADGMGGHAVGELASKIAADTIPHTYYKAPPQPVGEALKHAIVEANRAINERGTHNREFDRMGTTCTALVLSPDGALVGHVGDSRCYRVRSGTIEQLTFDHSLQWELIRQGRVSPEEVHLHHPRNVITRCLGPDSSVVVDLEGPHPIQPGDRFLLCSDGLTGHVEDDEIGCIVQALDPTTAAWLLIHLANLRGGSDNTTVVIVHVGEPPAGQQIEPEPAPQVPADQTSHAQLALVWGLAATFVAGAALVNFGNPPAGWALLIIASLAVIGMVIHAWRKRSPAGTATGATVANVQATEGPYRAAPARLTRSFLSRMASLVGELHQTAEEEEWNVDCASMQDLARRAAEEVEKKKPAAALRLYAEAIDQFMQAIQEQRRIRDMRSRWGRRPGDEE